MDILQGWRGRVGEYGIRRMHEGDVPYSFTVWGFGIKLFVHIAPSELAEGAGLDLESAQSGVEPWE